MEMERGCCGDRHCWMPEAILVPNGESTIDIAPTLVDNHDKYASLRTRQESLRVLFSTDRYPPVWDQRRIIEDAIIQAAAETNNPLIRTNTSYFDGEKPHHVSILGCKFSIPYRPSHFDTVQMYTSEVVLLASEEWFQLGASFSSIRR